jgi:hypothetical protein
MNIDYSICNALNRLCHSGIREALVEYDIVCSWLVNFAKRVSDSDHLTLPEALEIIGAVGKFHLGAHVAKCFALFSLNFVHGAGQQDGEILETLWATINKITSSIRFMSKSQQCEILDDLMRDSNWKKLVGMGT